MKMKTRRLYVLMTLSFLAAGCNTGTGNQKTMALKKKGVHRSQSLLPSDWDPVAAADDVMGKMIAVTPPEVKGAHDSDMVILDKHAYIVCMANNKRPGESARWPEVYAAMAIVNIETLHVEQWMPFAESGQAFENETLPIGAC